MFPEKPKGTIRISSFDIGKKNFAQYTEDADVMSLKLLQTKYEELPKKFQRRVKGEMSEEILDILDGVYMSSKRVQTGVYDLRSDKTSTTLDVQTRKNIICHLEKYRKLWETTDVFIIEQQYFKTWSGRSKKNRGTEANVDAIKIGECVMTWFLSEFPFAEVEYFGSQNKTQILGAPWSMTKTQRKKWAETKARDIYEYRQDYGMMELFKLQDRIFRKRLNTEEKIQEFLKTVPDGVPEDCLCLAEKLVRERQKLDDVGDACVQCQAYKYRRFIACF